MARLSSRAGYFYQIKLCRNHNIIISVFYRYIIVSQATPSNLAVIRGCGRGLRDYSSSTGCWPIGAWHGLGVRKYHEFNSSTTFRANAHASRAGSQCSAVLASSPGLRGEGKGRPGTHCMRMRHYSPDFGSPFPSPRRPGDEAKCSTCVQATP